MARKLVLTEIFHALRLLKVSPTTRYEILKIPLMPDRYLTFCSEVSNSDYINVITLQTDYASPTSKRLI